MESIIIEAPAKINLYLNILGRFANGYHDLDMLMQSISLSDMVKIKKARGQSTLSLCNHRDQTFVPLDEGNLALKAWRLLQKNYGLQGKEVDIHIEKYIPVGAGLAGGSSNAAAVLRGCNQLFDLRIPDEELVSLGAALGGDVPFCVVNGLARAEGIGERLTLLPALPRRNLVVVNPGISVLTGEIFGFYDKMKLSYEMDLSPLEEFCTMPTWERVDHLLYNALELPAVACYPVIQEVKADLEEIGLRPFMSGSGPSVIAFWERSEQQAAIEKYIMPKWPIVVLGYTK